MLLQQIWDRLGTQLLSKPQRNMGMLSLLLWWMVQLKAAVL